MSRFSQRRRNSRLGGMHEITEINVMPLVDLLLQLFIAVIIFAPVVEYGMGINLPKGTTNTIKHEQTRTVTVDRQGRVKLNDREMKPAELRAEFAKMAALTPPVTVLIKADEANNYGRVVQVLTDLHAAKITRIALMTQEDAVPHPAGSRR